MNQENLIQNIADQIKEAQIKLGYIPETVHLYYPVPSLNTLLETNCADAEEMQKLLQDEFKIPDGRLGNITFQIHNERIEVSIPPQGAEYVHREIENPAFLVDFIELFRSHHACSLDEICRTFEKYSSDYICEKMPVGADFDYAIHFTNPDIDEYYYCIKMEMGHSIYHRFSKADYDDIVRYGSL